MKILLIDACVRTESRTKILLNEVMAHLNGEVIHIDLNKENIKPLTRETLEQRNKLLEEKRFDNDSFKYAHLFANADEIVIAAPFWDLSFPAILKNFIEAVNVSGITFKYTTEGKIVGLCKAKRLIYVTTAGGKIPQENCGFGYIKALCENLYGINNLIFIKAEGLDIWGADVDDIMKKSKEQAINILFSDITNSKLSC